ncbi:MAG: hypothetical protein M3Z97_13905 [Candidatus Dormibacteraeota bacterium]|nr:hypothetical protein [Candidatus Dormibacteraeota bacterium]
MLGPAVKGVELGAVEATGAPATGVSVGTGVCVGTGVAVGLGDGAVGLKVSTTSGGRPVVLTA